jgi:hypothetical protein
LDGEVFGPYTIGKRDDYMVLELPESAANMATDPRGSITWVQDFNSCLLSGLRFFSNEALPQTVLRSSLVDMLDGLRQGLVSSWFKRVCEAQGE